MKKTYEAPMLLESGNVIHETLSGQADTGELNGQIMAHPVLVGGVGYYL